MFCKKEKPPCRDEILDAIETCLQKHGLKYHSDRNEGLVGLGMFMPTVVEKASFVFRVEEKRYVLYAQFPNEYFCVDKEKKPIMAKYLCRLNRFVNFGFFEFDFDGGEINFKLFIECDESVPSLEEIWWSFTCVQQMLVSYSQGIAEVIKAEHDADKLSPRPVNNVRALWHVLENEGEENNRT